MKHYVYRIDNLINGMYYIGKHSAESLDNDYMGSGTLIIKAIDKWGIENFKKTILKTFLTSDEAYEYEAQVVTMKEVDDPMCYNLIPGGKGKQKRFTDEELKEHALECSRKWREENPEYSAEYMREYNQKPEVKTRKREYMREYMHKWHEQNPNYRKEYYLKKKLEQVESQDNI